jgi:hypothetical protein
MGLVIAGNPAMTHSRAKSATWRTKAAMFDVISIAGSKQLSYRRRKPLFLGPLRCVTLPTPEL